MIILLNEFAEPVVDVLNKGIAYKPREDKGIGAAHSHSDLLPTVNKILFDFENLISL